MHIVLVELQVKPEYLAEFRKAILDNAQHSLHEVGILRFDVLQLNEDPSKFVLIEVYRNAEDHLAHRETAHYLRWRDTVADMMASPRQARIFENIFPQDSGWTKA